MSRDMDGLCSKPLFNLMLFDMGEGSHLLELLDRHVSGLGAMVISISGSFSVWERGCHGKHQLENGGLANH